MDTERSYEEILTAEHNTWRPKTTREEAERLLVAALRKAGAGLEYALQAAPGIGTDEQLLAVAHCADWIRGRQPRQTINGVVSSYAFARLVEAARCKQGDQVRYTSNSAFITAAIGLGSRYRFCGLHGYFNLSATRGAQ